MDHTADHKHEFEIIDPQNRKIAYSYMDIIELALHHNFASEVPPHFNAIFTKPDSIYIDTRNDIHCYMKTMSGKEYIVTTIEVMRNGRKRFHINSWFVKKDTNLETIMQLINKEHDDKLKEEIDKKINDSKTWMEVVYIDSSFLEGKKYKKAGITVPKNSDKLFKKGKNKGGNDEVS